MKSYITSWINVLRSPELGMFYLVLAVSLGVTWAVFHGTAYGALAWGFVATFFGGGLVFAVSMVRTAQKRFVVGLKEAAVHNWLKQAGSEEEAAQRRRQLQKARSLDERARMAGFNPLSANIDGTPMISQGIDAYGRPFGVTGLTSPVFDNDSGVWVSPAESYSAPVSFMSHDSHNHSSGGHGSF